MSKTKLIFEDGISTIEIVLILVSFLGIIFLRPLIGDLSIFSNIDRDTDRILLYYIPFPLILLFIFVNKGFKGFKKELIPRKLILWSGINIMAVLVIQLIPVILFSSIPQSATIFVTLLFVFSAIAEEVFYRLFLVGLMQLLLVKFFKNKIDDKISPIIFGIIFSVLSAMLFMASHTNYWENSIAMTITIMTGIVQGILYTIHREGLVIILAHVILNIIAVQTIIQYI